MGTIETPGRLQIEDAVMRISDSAGKSRVGEATCIGMWNICLIDLLCGIGNMAMDSPTKQTSTGISKTKNKLEFH